MRSEVFDYKLTLKSSVTGPSLKPLVISLRAFRSSLQDLTSWYFFHVFPEHIFHLGLGLNSALRDSDEGEATVDCFL